VTPRFLYLGLIGLGLGIIIRLAFEAKRYHAWDTLEDEVDEWRRSPRGRFNGYLDGLTESP